MVSRFVRGNGSFSEIYSSFSADAAPCHQVSLYFCLQPLHDHVKKQITRQTLTEASITSMYAVAETNNIIRIIVSRLFFRQFSHLYQAVQGRCLVFKTECPS